MTSVAASVAPTCLVWDTVSPGSVRLKTSL
jgi:hypothetical protein